MQGFVRHAREMTLPAVLPGAYRCSYALALDSTKGIIVFDRYRGFSKGSTRPDALYLEADGSEEHTLFLVRNQGWTNIPFF